MTRNFHTLLSAAIALLGGFSIGMDMGLFNVALPYLGSGLSEGRVSALTTVAPIGIMVGALGVGALSDAWGRKRVLWAAILIFGSGIATCAFLHGFVPLLLGRVLVGAASGMYFGAIPVLLGESLPSKGRGFCLVLFALGPSVGLLVAGALGSWLTPGIEAQLQTAAHAGQTALINDRAWRTLLLLGGIPTALFLAVAWRGSESPRWLFAHGKKGQARSVLVKNWGPAQGPLIMAEMEDLAQAHSQKGAADSLWQKHYLRPLALGLGIFVLNNAVASGVINTYSTTLFVKVGLNPTEAAEATAWMQLMGFLGSVGGLLLINRMGRKILAGLGLAVAMVAAGVAGATLWLNHSGHLHLEAAALGWFVFGCMGLYQGALALGPGACGWVLVSELMPTRVRSNGMGLGILLGSLTNVGLMTACLPTVNHLGLAGQWGIWGGICVFYFCFVIWMLPETRGQTLEEVEALFAKKA